MYDDWKLQNDRDAIPEPGARSHLAPRACERCNGRGTYSTPNRTGGRAPHLHRCQECAGTGAVAS